MIDVYVFVLAIVAMALSFLGFVFYCVYRIVADRRRARILSDEEGRALQELWKGLQGMEDRIANLETILMDRERDRPR